MTNAVSRPMARRKFLAVSGGLPLLAACATSPLQQAAITPVPASNQPPEVAAPVWAVGNRWSYTLRSGLNGVLQDTVSMRVSAAEPSGYTVEEVWQSIGPVQARYDRNLNALRTRNVVNQPAFPRYRFPLSIGQAWSATVLSERQPVERYGRWRQEMQGRVGGWERITVPAGSFTALRIDIQITSHNVDSAQTWGNTAETAWFVPSLRNLALYHRVDFFFGRQEVGNDVMELDSFNVGAPG
jgi:hypothetical protein